MTHGPGSRGAHVRLVLAALAALVLAGCATRQPQLRPPPATLQLPPRLEARAPASRPSIEAADLWQRLRAGFAFADCDAADVRRWAATYTRHPGVFSRQLDAVLPQLDYIAQRVDAADVPAEFALLPWVESNFRALPAHGNRAAGMWQIMPATGRELGLRIDRDVDERLDLEASTRAALRLLRRDHALLGDWVLTDMAFHAGVYRVRRLLRQHPAVPGQERAHPPGLQRITLDHAAKLQALACIIATPASWNVALPGLAPERELLHRPLEHGLPLPVLAGLAEVPPAQLRALNPAPRHDGVALRGVIITRSMQSTFDTALAVTARRQWQQWQHVRLTRTLALRALGAPSHTAARQLAAVNGRSDIDVELPGGTHLWLPTRLLRSAGEVAQPVPPPDAPPTHYTVRAGDSLWSIARRFRLRVTELRTRNRLRGDLLHPGQILRLPP